MIKLNSTLGEEYVVDPDDVKRVKRALNRIGHYETPDYGITSYPDRRLFEGIRDFQTKEKLQIDGVMKPDGETIAALNSRLPSNLPGVRSPTFWCACGAPHGGVHGNICDDCFRKL